MLKKILKFTSAGKVPGLSRSKAEALDSKNNKITISILYRGINDNFNSKEKLG